MHSLPRAPSSEHGNKKQGISLEELLKPIDNACGYLEWCTIVLKFNHHRHCHRFEE